MKLAEAEKDHMKCQKLNDLQLKDMEWDQVKKCLDLLTVNYIF